MTAEPAGPRTAIVAVAGNPRPGSRTLTVAGAVAAQIVDGLGRPDPVIELDLAEVADQLFAVDAPDADRYRATLAGAAVAVVATPVYKASYTGLLKAFLDRYPTGGLRGVVAVPVVVSASPAHSFVAEHLLGPLLVELGAVVPVRGLAVVEGQLADLDTVVTGWAAEAVPVLAAVARATRT